MQISRAVIALCLMGAVASAEGVGSQAKVPGTPSKVLGVTTLWPVPGGGFVTLGGPALRRLVPGAKEWETLQTVAGDDLYRVAVDPSGAVLAAWEKDASIHLLVPATKKHLAFPKPPPALPHLSIYRVSDLVFLPGASAALMHFEGELHGNTDVHTVYRQPLTEGAAPELLYTVESGRLLRLTAQAAVFVIPKKPGQECTQRSCSPVQAVVAYELGATGVTQRVLVDGAERPIANANLVWAEHDAAVTTLMLDVGGQDRAVLRWRPGEAKADVRPFPKEKVVADRVIADGATGEVLEAFGNEGKLVLRRHAPDGTQTEQVIPGIPNPADDDLHLHGLGRRADGSLWLQWGDFVVLLPQGKPPRAHSLEPLLARRTEWAGVDLYDPSPEALWVGIDARGRSFVRVSFADLEKSAKPW